MEEKEKRKLGIAIISIGLVLLLFTFYLSYNYLKSPYPSAAPVKVQPSDNLGQPDINAAMSQALAPFFDSMIPLAYSTSYLFIMGLVGFWVMGRGIQMVK